MPSQKDHKARAKRGIEDATSIPARHAQNSRARTQNSKVRARAEPNTIARESTDNREIHREDEQACRKGYAPCQARYRARNSQIVRGETPWSECSFGPAYIEDRFGLGRVVR